MSSPRRFSRQHGITDFALRLGIRSQTLAHGFACAPSYTLTPGQPPPGRATLLRHPSGSPTPGSVRAIPPAGPEGPAGFTRLASPVPAWTAARGYGNINPLSIDYACRPRLRPRLTLGGLACPRNPWSFGGGVSHPSFATHACILTRVASTAGSLRRFPRHPTLPYPPAHLGPKGVQRPRSGRPRPKPRRPRPPSTLATKGLVIARVPQLRRCA